MEGGSENVPPGGGGGGGARAAQPQRVGRAPLAPAEGSPPHVPAPPPPPGSAAVFGGAAHAGLLRHPAHPANDFLIAVDPGMEGNGGRASTAEAVFRRW